MFRIEVNIPLREGHFDTGLGESSIDLATHFVVDRPVVVERIDEKPSGELNRIVAKVFEDDGRRRFIEYGGVFLGDITENPEGLSHIAAVSNSHGYDQPDIRIGKRPVQQPPGDEFPPALQKSVSQTADSRASR